jgi:putative hydrolase
VHTLLELVEIATRKRMEMLNVSDHGPALGRSLNLAVFLDPQRLPSPIRALSGRPVVILRGIEANVLNADGETDIPMRHVSRFDLVTLGFHPCGDLHADRSESQNTRALVNAATRYPFDILAHPCISTYPLDLETVVDLSREYGFALELNNTKLRLNRSDAGRLARMATLAVGKGARLVETSDGHTFHEIGENECVETLVAQVGLNADAALLNRDDGKLLQFVAERRARRQRWPA